MSAEKKINLQKLIQDYNEMKINLSKAAELLKLERNKNLNFIETTQSLEVKNHSLEEENNTLKANYSFIQKRYDQLQKELSETKKSTKSYSMLSYFTGGGIKEENEEMKERIKMLESELEIKIKENEECHVEVFEYKKQYNDKINEFEEKEEEYKKQIENKSKELISLSDKNIKLLDMKKNIESDLNVIKKEFEEQTKMFNKAEIEYQNKENNLKKEIQYKNNIINKVICIDEFINDSNIKYNIDILNNISLRNQFLSSQIGFINSTITLVQNSIFDIGQPFIDYIKERNAFFDVITSENKKTNFIYQKIKFHLSSLSQLFISINLFFIVLQKAMSNSININSIILYKNIILTLIHRASTRIKIIIRYYNEATKYTNYFNDVDIELIKITNKILSLYDVISLRCECIFDYNKEYNIKKIHISQDQTFHIKIIIDSDYFKKYQSKGVAISKANFIIDTFSYVSKLRIEIEKFIAVYKRSLSKDNELFTKHREDNKNKFNVKFVKIEDAIVNGDNINKLLLKIVSNITSLADMKDQVKDVFVYKYFDKEILLLPLSLFILKRISKRKEHNCSKDEITYDEAIRNKEELNVMKQNENVIKEDKIKNQKKYEEYESKINKLQELLANEQNSNDLLRLKLTDKSFISEQSAETSKNNNECNEFDEYINNQKNIMDKEYMMLNLGDEKFAVNSKEVDLEYHQRMNEIIKRYLTKIKTIDVKVAASVKEKEIRKECENAIKEIKQKYKENEIELNKQINQKNDAIEGFMQQITYLSESMNEYEEIKEKLCANCRKYVKDI